MTQRRLQIIVDINVDEFEATFGYPLEDPIEIMEILDGLAENNDVIEGFGLEFGSEGLA